MCTYKKLQSYAFEDKTKRRELVTNASLRMKRLPDDIPVMEVKEKEHSALDEFVEGRIEDLVNMRGMIQELII